VVRAGLGGVAEKVFDFLLESILSLGSFSLATGSFPLASHLLVAAPRISKLDPFLATIENSSEKRGRGIEFFGSTWDWEELLVAPATPFANCVETSRWKIGEGDR
jgi:hypothetical protein